MLPVFYFLIIRPKQQEVKKKEEMRSALKKGDKVLTQAGILGVVNDIKEDIITLKLSENTKVDFTKDAILDVVK